MKAFKKFLIISTLMSTHLAMASGTLTISPEGGTHYHRTNGQTGELIYHFNVQNQLTEPLYLNGVSTTGNLPNVALNTNETTCPLHNGTALAASTSCQLVYQSSIPSLAYPDTEQSFNEQFTITDGLGYQTTSSSFGVNVYPDGYLGHLVFRNQAGDDISSLDLSPDNTGTVTLHNTGGTAITDFNVNIPDTLSSSFADDCGSTLSPDSSCSLRYTIPADQTTLSSTIDFTGSAANNLPRALTVNLNLRAYIGSYNGDVTVCNIESDGGLADCQPAVSGGFLYPASITLNRNFSYAYIADIADAAGRVEKCTVNPTDGTLTDCSSGTFISSPIKVILNPNAPMAYISSDSSNPLYECSVTEDGDFTHCQAVVSFSFNDALSMAIDHTGSTLYIVSRSDDGSLYECHLNHETGAVDSCVPRKTSIASVIYGLSLNPDNSWAYITGLPNIVAHFNLTTDTLVTQNAPDLGISYPHGIAINATDTQAYVVGSNKIYRCLLTSTGGNLSECAATGGDYSFIYPTFITLTERT